MINEIVLNEDERSDAEQLLKEKMGTLKKNLDNVGRDVLKTKYAKAYGNLLKEINELSNTVIREKMCYLDIMCVREEVRPQFAAIIVCRYQDVRKHLLNGDYEAYTKLVDEIAVTYINLWIENVERGYKDGIDIITNPFAFVA